jgi:hypothetical protein
MESVALHNQQVFNVYRGKKKSYYVCAMKGDTARVDRKVRKKL